MAGLPLRNIVEAALLAAGEALSLERLARLFSDVNEEQRPTDEALLQMIAELRADYSGRSLELLEVASGFRLQVKQDYAPWVARLWEERPVRYSRALMETLALIAYRQPITRPEIEDIRGVAVSSQIIRTLTERDWIRVAGHREVPGRPALYATTQQFVDHFNLKSLDELPTLAELRDLNKISFELGFGLVEAEAETELVVAALGQAEDGLAS